jgi:ABC-type antimicrobial peptide transport system permease subunit
VRADRPPSTLLREVRRTLRDRDANLAFADASSLREHVNRSAWQPRMVAQLMGVFSFVALAIAALGIYGVMAYTVTQRTREIGIRVALGARTEDVLRSVVANGLGVVLAGVAAGLTASVFLAGLLGDALFGVSPHDAGVLTLVSVVLVATALVANGVPARRAARIDPMRTLRTE